jgi:hypothetical protein
MAYLQHNQYGIKDSGTSTNVPGNDLARLMYYLDCACNAVDYNDNNISRYRKYNNWSQLTNEDIRLLVVLCYTLSPDIFNIIKYSFIRMLFVVIRRINFTKSVKLVINCWL